MSHTQKNITRRLDSIEKSRYDNTLSLIEELASFHHNPYKLDNLDVSALRALSKKRATAISSLKYFKFALHEDSNNEKPILNSINSNNDYYRRTFDWLRELDGTIQKHLDNKLKIKGRIFSFSALFVHLIILFWLLTSHKEIIFPLYLVLGTILFFFLSKSLGRYFLKFDKSHIPLLPKPISLIFIPLVSIALVAILFISPNRLPIEAMTIAKITQPVKLGVRCGSSIKLRDILTIGGQVIIEDTDGNCFRIKTMNGAVGYVYREAVKILKYNNLQRMRNETIWVILGAITLTVLCYLGHWVYLSRIIPLLLKRKVSKNETFLRQQIKNTQLIKEELLEEEFIDYTDIQKAKSDLIIKLTDRFHKRSQKIIDSPILSQGEKNKMIDYLAKQIALALKGS